MGRAGRVAIIMTVLELSYLGAALAVVQNMLPNPSFEAGRQEPEGWRGFGLGGRRWEYGGADGDRCLAAVGDGAYTNGWYASRWSPVEANRVYRASFQVRRQPGGDTGWVRAGLNAVRRYSTATERWERQSFHFRAPDHRSNLRFEVGETRLKGTAYFDDVSLVPSLPIYRSGGLGRFVLGDGERIVDWQYTAEFRPEGSQLNNRRFLLRFMGEYARDRFVLRDLEAVYFAHEIEIFGMPLLEAPVKLSPQARVELKGYWAETDPEAMKFIAQEVARFEVDVARCQGVMFVQAARSLKGPWHMLGEVRSPGTYKYTVSREIFPARHVYVRLWAFKPGQAEITGYRYNAHLLFDRKEEPLYGSTHYVDILEQSPEVSFRVLDAGELAPGGRNGVKLELTHTGERRRLVVSVMVKKGNEITYVKETSFRVSPETKTLRTFPYEIKSPGPQTLMVVVRDEKTSEILLDLSSDFDAPEQAAPSASVPLPAVKK